MLIELTYTNFKTLVDTNKKLFWQYNDTGEQYDIFADDQGITYLTHIIKNSATKNIVGLDTNQETANQTDFETNYKDNINTNRSLLIGSSSTQSNFYGKTIEIAGPDASGYCEWEFDNDVFINKILPIPVNGVFGDYVDLEILLKSDNMSLAKYASNIYLVGDKPNQWFHGNGGGRIPNFCKVRATYYKVGSEPRQFIIIGEFLI